MAFAIIETGGKQYRITEGASFRVEKLNEYKVGDTVVFEKVLLLDDGEKTTIGTPYIEGKTVEVILAGEVKGKKLHIQKFKAKSRYKRRLGHRQQYANVQVQKI